MISNLDRKKLVNVSKKFIDELKNIYGDKVGDRIWKTIFNSVDSEFKSDLVQGMLTGVNQIKVLHIHHDYKIRAVKNYRHLTSASLREALDAINVVFEQQRKLVIDVSNYNDDLIETFIKDMKEIGTIE